MDSDTWRIQYREIKTHNFTPGKTVLLSPEWVQSVSWSESQVRVSLSSEMIKTAPAYSDSVPVSREYKNRIHQHYGKVPYWHYEIEYVSGMKAGK